TKMGNIGLTYQEYTQAGSESDQPTSNNALLNGNEYHALDASEASGMNVIDFPIHRLFGNATDAFGIAKSGDRLYNDATYNVVYVDSYDYGPEINERTRFSGGTAAWAENLNLMFTFRGIPCLLYGSEIEFRNGKILDIDPIAPLKETGRAYYGGYITGDVTATGFGSYSDANGNVAATLSKPLARHIARLSQIRQQVPALRKGQYSTEGCEGTIAFKRRYTNGDIDSYALVAISGAATFTGVLNGEYTEVITGAKVTVSDGTLSSPEITKGNMRVYVLNGTSKIGEDGQYLFDTTANYSSVQIYDGHEEDDCVEKPEDCKLKFSPETLSFDGETLEVTITPTSRVVSAWYKVGEDGTKTDITIGTETKITIGEGIESGDIVIYYGYTGETGIETTRSVTYNKTGNEAPSGPEITIYVKGAEAPNIYAWVEDESGSTTLTEIWPGTKMTESTTINGENFWYHTISGYSSFNYIINNGSTQTGGRLATGDCYLDENWYDITEEVIKGSGGTDEPTPATHTYTVAGSPEILNGEYLNPASETNRMTSTDGVTYTLEVKNAVLTAGTYKYIVCEDSSWDVWYPAGDNATLTIPADGTYDITYTYVVGDAEPSYSIKPSEGSSLVLFSAHYGLAGSEDKTELMLLKGSDGKWKSTIEGLTAGNYEIVVKGTDGSSYPESPVNFNATIDNPPYEVSFDETTKDVIVNIPILNFTVAGDDIILNGVGWNPASETNRMTSTDGVTYTLEVKNAVLTAGTYGYKVFEDGDWIVTYPAENNATLTIPADGTYDITYTYVVGDAEPSAVAKVSGTGEEIDTGITLVNGSANAADRIYDLQGRPVVSPAKGVYIKNGRKVVY
ncbi:MAG: starch-binding protein, partial [Prevotella sp.]|nr:starch-binding protein [Prevotella sp.]